MLGGRGQGSCKDNDEQKGSKIVQSYAIWT